MLGMAQKKLHRDTLIVIEIVSHEFINFSRLVLDYILEHGKLQIFISPFGNELWKAVSQTFKSLILFVHLNRLPKSFLYSYWSKHISREGKRTPNQRKYAYNSIILNEFQNVTSIT